MRVALCLCLLLAGTAFGQTTDDRYTLRVTDAVGDVGFPFEVSVFYDAQDGVLGAPEALSGWAYGLCHDAAVLDLIAVVDGAAIAASSLSFNSVELDPQPGTGFTVTTVVDFFGVDTLLPGLDQELNLATYEVVAITGPFTTLDFCNGLGTPVTTTVVVTPAATSSFPEVESGIITFGSVGPLFVRGECNNDGSFNLSDVIFLLNYLFPQNVTAPLLPCVDACDSNNDGALNLADTIASLVALFGTPAVPLPGSGSCAADTGSDLFDCFNDTSCP